MANNPVIVIPARMASTRLPGKPLADIGGKSMIVRVMECGLKANIGPVVVACGDEEIFNEISNAGGQAILTEPGLTSGSDRVYAALNEFDPDGKHDVVINLQGDLPLIDPATIKAVLAALITTDAHISTLVAEITDRSELSDTHVVKADVSFAKSDDNSGNIGDVGDAINFSRQQIASNHGPHYHHIGIYAFRRSALERFVGLQPSMLEKRENLEQLRALENGMSISCGLVDTVPFGVDTPSDLERARKIIAGKV